MRIGSHGRVGIDRNRDIDLLRLIRDELEPRHLADADAVEKHRGPGKQARNRIVEPHFVAGALAKPALRFKPVHEGKARHDSSEGEEADQNIACLDFHWT